MPPAPPSALHSLLRCSVPLAPLYHEHCTLLVSRCTRAPRSRIAVAFARAFLTRPPSTLRFCLRMLHVSPASDRFLFFSFCCGVVRCTPGRQFSAFVFRTGGCGAAGTAALMPLKSPEPFCPCMGRFSLAARGAGVSDQVNETWPDSWFGDLLGVALEAPLKLGHLCARPHQLL